MPVLLCYDAPRLLSLSVASTPRWTIRIRDLGSFVPAVVGLVIGRR